MNTFMKKLALGELWVSNKRHSVAELQNDA
jgi:hypothetical protein